jgi:FKBP-type peptidyl-prolyl cis-trans isomerase
MGEAEEKDARLGGRRPTKGLPEQLKKRSKKNNKANNVFNLFIICLMGYAFFKYVQDGGDAGMLSQIGTHLEVIDAYKEGDPRIDRLRAENLYPNDFTRLTPIKRSAVARQTLSTGEGPPALCGQEVRYRIVEGFGQDQKVSEPQSFHLGDPQKPLGLTLALEGMRPGEVAQATIPPELWSGGAAGSLGTSLVLELESAQSDFPDNPFGLRRFIRRAGSGYRLRCGDLAIMHLSFYSGKGEVLFDSRKGDPVAFFLGDGNVPYGLEQGVQSMARGGKYSLILSSDFLHIPKNTAINLETIPYQVQPFPADLSFPQDQLVLVDIDYPAGLTEKKVSQPLVPAKEIPPLKPAEMPVTEPVVEPVTVP